MILVVVLGLIGGSHALLCYDDFELDDVQDYTYVLDKEPLSKYWSKHVEFSMNKNGERTVPGYNMHLSYTVFGKFVGDPSDATITAGYYKQDNSLIYSIKVDCGAGTWSSYTPNLENPQEQELYQEGDLEENCIDGDIFDVILKVQQAHLMNWMYNGQPLQQGSQIIEHRVNGQPIERTRTLYVPSPDTRPQGGAASAKKLKIHTTGAAVITRLAFGRCIAWPAEITRNCSAVNEWIVKRSKSSTAGQDLYGYTGVQYAVECFPDDTTLYMWLQSAVHPDEFSKPGTQYCCCVNMETGDLFTGDKDVDCQGDACDQTCTHAFDPDLLTN